MESTDLHELVLKKLKLDWNTMDTDLSNDIFDKCSETSEQINDLIKDLIEEVKEEIKRF